MPEALLTPDELAGYGTDVIVVGSGAAALSAALAAAHDGLRVLVLEKSAWLGGTSAMSGAGTWIPASHIARAAGYEDSPEAALEYLRATGPEGWADTEDERWVAFAEQAPEALELICRLTPLEFLLTPEPDPMAEYAGGRTGGRMLTPDALPLRVAGPLRQLIRRSTLPHLFTYIEGHEDKPFGKPVRALMKLWPRLVYRALTGRRGQGSALIAGLLAGCLDQGVRFAVKAEVRELATDELGGVTGVRVAHEDGECEVPAMRGVVLATGGFEWDAERFERHFPGLTDRIGSPRSNTGDGQRMAEAVGAALGHMDQANVYATVPTVYEGRLHGLPALVHGSAHSIVVNRHGRRIASELDYNFGEVLDARDPATGEPLHTPAWLIGDARFWRGSGMLRWYARKDPGWVRHADTLPALAELTDLPPEALSSSVVRFNTQALAGRDDDFHRGESTWERYKTGATEGEPPRSLGTLEQAPFVAIPLNRSVLGTKGGPMTDRNGQVVREDGSVIAGLWCAGVAMANPIGTRAVGAGTTIGPCLTWGHICARAIGRTNR